MKGTWHHSVHFLQLSGNLIISQKSLKNGQDQTTVVKDAQLGEKTIAKCKEVVTV